MKKFDWYIVVLACLVSWILLWGSISRASAAPTGQFDVLTPNVCPEGQYLDLSTGYCRNLHKNFGFDATVFTEEFTEREVIVDTCSERALLEALGSVAESGGLVQLPACALEISAPITLPDHLILQGAGQGDTVLRATSNLAGENLLTIKEGNQVIVRDLTLDGAGHAERTLLAWYADNILVERVETMNAASSGIVFRYTSRITIRYIDSHDNQENHGIGSKDCFGETLSDCEDEAGQISTGALWSQDYAIYSNDLHNNGTYGLDSHASYGEIAGNLMTNNGYGSKFPNASYLWIHHNRIENNESWGTHLYSTLQIPERYPQNIVFYQNEFVGNGDHPLIASAPVKNVYMIRNTFRENASDLLRTSNVVVYVCGDEEGEISGTDGTEAETAEAVQCNLGSVARLFGERLLGRADRADGELLPEVQAPIAAAPAPTATAIERNRTAADESPTAVPTPTSDSSPTFVASAEVPYTESITVPGRIEAEWYRPGGEGVGYSDSTLENAGETYRDDDVDVEVTSDDHGEHSVGWITEGEWLAYAIDVQRAGEYTLTARLRTWESEPRALHVEFNGMAISEPVEFTESPDGAPWFDVSLGQVQLARGQHELRVVMDSDKFNFNYLDVDLVAPASTPASRWIWPFPQLWLQE